jgi:hypothetical protein
MINRRGLLIGLGSLIAAPAVVRAASLMPVRRPALLTWTQISLEDYAKGLQREEIFDWLHDGPIFEGMVAEYRGYHHP